MEKRQLSVLVSISIVTLLCLSVVYVPPPVAAQTILPCDCVRVASNIDSAFPAGSVVTIYADGGGWNDSSINAIRQAKNNWNAAFPATTPSNERVYFSFFEASPEHIDFFQTPFIQVVRQPVPGDPTTPAAFNIGNASRDANGRIIGVTIYISPLVTDPRAVLNQMVHEMGHGMGLDDNYCGLYDVSYNACQADSIMSAARPVPEQGLTGLNIVNCYDSPTACDITVVREVFRELNQGCIEVSLNGTYIFNYKRPDLVEMSTCLNKWPNESQQQYAPGYLSSDINVHFESRYPVSNIGYSTIDCTGCNFVGTLPWNLSQLNGQREGDFTLLFSTPSNQAYTGIARVGMFIDATQGTSAPFVAQRQCSQSIAGGWGDEPPPEAAPVRSKPRRAPRPDAAPPQSRINTP